MTSPRHSSPAIVIVVGALSAVVLLATASAQIVDTNFYTLWEATNLLAGDHPYRDFYEWGVPLQAYVSALGQLVFGYRLIGEFVLQWAFIVAGMVIACHLALRLCPSRAAVMATMIPAALLLAVTPTYHYPKLFFYPLAIWLAWRYLDWPAARRAAALGVVSALGFLFRHDHGVYIAVAAAMALVLARLGKHGSRNVGLFVNDGVACCAAALLVLAPWLAAVQRSEGLGEYIGSRAQLYQAWSASTYPILALARTNPVRELFVRPRPAPKSGVVGFIWSSEVPEDQQRLLQAEHHLRPLGQRDDEGRYLFEVPDVFDANLIGLDPFIRNGAGFQFDTIRDSRSWFPSIANAQLWLMQFAFLVPAVLLVLVVVRSTRANATANPLPDTYHFVVASVFLLVAESRLFREASYVVTVSPLVAVLAAPLLRPPWREGAWMRAVRLTVTISLLGLTLYAVAAWIRTTDVVHPAQISESIEPTFRRMTASPPIDAYESRDHAIHVSRDHWDAGEVNRGAVLMRYMFDCAAPGDRVIVTGVTPFHVGYYVNLPIAGGHLFWHHRWRSDPVHEQQSLALLQRQSVPFVFSADDPVFEDFKPYPSILAYLRANYVEVDGSSGLMLVDRRRTPVRTFGELGLPCFR